ncbi:MAG: hypothetical protein WCG40_10000 [Actinomycetes bacterium]
MADLVQGLLDQAVLALGDHLALVRVDQVVLGMMIVLLVAILATGLLGVMIGALLVTGLLVAMIGVQMIVRHVEILVTVPRVVMTAAQMIVRHVATEQIPAQALLGDHLVLVRAGLVVLVMTIVRRDVSLVIVLRVVMIGVLLVIGLLVGILVIGLLVGTVLARVGRLVRAVMTAVMVGDEAVPVKKILLPASRVMRPSGGVQQFVHAVLVPFVRT